MRNWKLNLKTKYMNVYKLNSHMKIVLVGASNNEEKFGNKIMKDLMEKWHEVVPVNPNEKEVEWIRTHKLLNTVPKNFDVVNFIVLPNVTLQILKKYKDLLVNKKVWIQPWAEDDEIETFLKDNWFKDCVTKSCIMVQKID